MAKIEEEILNKLINALLDDFEQGVHWLGNQQAEIFKTSFPNLSQTLSDLIESYLRKEDNGNPL